MNVHQYTPQSPHILQMTYNTSEQGYTVVYYGTLAVIERYNCAEQIAATNWYQKCIKQHIYKSQNSDY